MHYLIAFTFISYFFAWFAIGLWCYKNEFHCQGCVVATFFISIIYTTALYSILGLPVLIGFAIFGNQ